MLIIAQPGRTRNVPELLAEQKGRDPAAAGRTGDRCRAAGRAGKDGRRRAGEAIRGIALRMRQPARPARAQERGGTASPVPFAG